MGIIRTKNWHRMGAKTKLQKSWVWNKPVEDFVRTKIKGYSLNCCAGKSSLGDVKTDIDPKDPEIMPSEMRNLPFKDNTFDTVIQDPPMEDRILSENETIF